MHISVWVPYDEQQMRRFYRHIIRRQSRTFRILGGVLIALGVALIAINLPTHLGSIPLGVGLLITFGSGPITVANLMRMTPSALKTGYQLTLDDEWTTLTAPCIESRFRWSCLEPAIETPEIWYFMLGKSQTAVIVPKNAMTQEQEAEFAAFVNRLQPVRN